MRWDEYEAELKERIVRQILTMKDKHNQIDHARRSLVEYDRLLPWLNLKQAVKEAMQ